MPCLFVLFALAAPRIVMVLLYLFTQWFVGVYQSALVPVLGFFFLPTTTLWYSCVQHWFDGQWTPGAIVGAVIAVVIDLSPASGRRKG